MDQDQRPPNRSRQRRRDAEEERELLRRWRFFIANASTYHRELREIAAGKERSFFRFQLISARPYYCLLQSIRYERVINFRDICHRMPDIQKMKHSTRVFSLEYIENALKNLECDESDRYWLAILMPRIVQPGLLEELRGWEWCKSQDNASLTNYQADLDSLIPSVEKRLSKLASVATPHLMEEPLHSLECSLQAFREDVMWAINAGIEVHRDNMLRVKRLRAEGIIDMDPWMPGCKYTPKNACVVTVARRH